MSADDGKQPQGGIGFLGFSSYADDTPRDADGARLGPEPSTWREPVPPEEGPHAWDEADTPDAMAARPADSGAPPRVRRVSRAVVAAGLALTAATALAFAWGLSPGRDAAQAPPSPDDARPAGRELKIVPAAPSLAMTTGAEPTTLLPTVSSLPSPTQSAVSAPPPIAPPAPFPRQLAAAPPPPPQLAPQAERFAALPPNPAELPPRAAEPRAQPPAQCGSARTRAEQMVCADPGLAAADRQMVRAYRAALAAGAPERALSLEQREWLNAREEAARRSPQDVADLYAQRLDDLAEWRAGDEPR